ncbi:MAG: hypothetical protein Q8L09_03665 [Candidatus Moranbacteria bacterium]|nr:hypothetical protein [Candidatus Moranbacteria bacterium]
MFNQHPLADPRAAPIELMGYVPQCGKEKSPRMLAMPAGQRMDEFTIKVNLGSPRGVYHFHPANNTLLAEADYGQKKRADQALPAEFCKGIPWEIQDFADAKKAKGAIFDPRTCMAIIATSRGTPAYALLTATAVPFEVMLQ